MSKEYDIVAVVGEYTNSQGEVKKRYENVGSAWRNRDGGLYLTLKRTFNPAGVPFREGSDSIILNLYAPKENSERGRGGGHAQPGQRMEHHPGTGGARNGYGNPSDLDDEIPF